MLNRPMEIWKRFHEKEATHSMVHYLQAIAAITHASGAASVSAIADRLAVSRAGVTSMVRTLKGRGLVEHVPYGDVRLTREGGKLAARTERGREVLTRFFEETLAIPAPTAQEDACMIEHLVSPVAMVELLRLTAFLNSDDDAAARFRAAFRAYQERCAAEESESCPICHGRCLSRALEFAESESTRKPKDEP